MSLTPIETVGFEDISAMIDICRNELERSGFIDQAEALRGIEVLDRSGAEVALLTLRGMPEASYDIDVLKRHIVGTLNRLATQAAA